MLLVVSKFAEIASDAIVEVPMPTLPAASMTNIELSGDAESSTTNEGPAPTFVTESLPHGVDVPMPTLFEEFTRSVLPPTLSNELKRLVELAVVAKKFVLVALVVVEFPTLRSERVEDENTMMPPPPFGVMSLPVEVAHLEFGVSPAPVKQVVADTRPLADDWRQPEPVARKRFEVEAVFVKRLVVVALDPVAFTEVKLPRKPVPRLKLVEKRLVEEAVVAKVFVVVAFVPVAFPCEFHSQNTAPVEEEIWKTGIV
jgi:hypothetical protein